MGLPEGSFRERYKWHIVIIVATVLTVLFLALFTPIFEKSETGLLQSLVWLLGALILLSGFLAMLSRVFKILDALRDNSSKLEEVAGALEKIRAGLVQINQSTRLSETAKAIAFRDEERRSLREAVFEILMPPMRLLMKLLIVRNIKSWLNSYVLRRTPIIMQPTRKG